MTKLLMTLEAAQILHKNGQLNEAKQVYLSLLQTDPSNIEILHLLGILCAETNELEEAALYIEKAIALAPHHPALTLHLANILKAKGDLKRAEALLLQMTQDHPTFAATYNNLGTIYFAEEKWEKAVEAYHKAIFLQANYVDAYYNLGLALSKLSRFAEAKNTYQAILEISPHHPGAKFQLGSLYMQQGEYEKAFQQFTSLEKAHPFHFETQVNLATSALKLGRFPEARTHYLKGLELVPTDNQILFNLGVIALQQGKLDEAITFYTKAIKNDPDFFDAHYNLGFIFLIKNDKASAMLHFREAARLHPNDISLKHTLNILMHKKDISVSPPEYVRALFDSYADHFDPHLKEFLHYQVPKVLFATVKAVKNAEETTWDILDIGCGTGLTGELFKPFARTLLGVDLSQKMLAIAAQKNIYDELIAADILPYLADKEACFDLVIAGDVIVYYGDLTTLFAAIYRALRPGGFFVFNTEINANEDFTLTESGRFAHSKAYLDKLALGNHFKIKEYKVATMRTQNYQPVLGHLYLLRKL